MNEISAAWELIGKSAAGIGILVAIVQGFKYLRSQTSIARLETKVEDQGQKLEKDYKHLEAIDTRLAAFEKRLMEYEDKQTKETEKINASLERLGASLAAIMHNIIDGSGAEKLKEERDKLVDFFITNK